MKAGGISSLARATLLTLAVVCVAAQESPPAPDTDAAYAAALRLFQVGDYDGVLERLQSSTMDERSRGDVQNLKGAALMRQKKWDAAAEAFRDAYSCNTNLVEALFNEGEVRFAQARYGQALSIYDEFLKSTPEHEFARFRVFLCRLLNDETEAAKQAMDAFEITPTNPSFHYAQAAWHFRQGGIEEALYFVHAARNMYPRAATVFYLQCLIDLGWLLPAQAE